MQKNAEEKTGIGGRRQQRQWTATPMDGRWMTDGNNNNRLQLEQLTATAMGDDGDGW